MSHKPVESCRIVVCGTARNVESIFPIVYTKLVRAFAQFLEVQFLFCESFSSDNTKEVLKDFDRNYSNFKLIIDDSISPTESRRTVRIASARNLLQRTISETYLNYDYVVMVDLDGVNNDLTSNAIKSVWNHSNWDVAFANQPLRYYDIWALRAVGWCETDWVIEYNELLKSVSKRKAKNHALSAKMKSIPEKSAPIKVKSAFGGLGIYRMTAFLSGEYLGMNEQGQEVCEHVYFHNQLCQAGYKLYIIPSLVNLNRRTQTLNIVKEIVLRITGKIN